MTSETLIRVSYYGIFGRNQHSESLPPPFIYIPLEWKIQNFPLFGGRTQYSWVPRGRCLPFLPPPFLNFWKVQNMFYKFCMYHFSSKCVVLAVQTHFLKKRISHPTKLYKKSICIERGLLNHLSKPERIRTVVLTFDCRMVLFFA